MEGTDRISKVHKTGRRDGRSDDRQVIPNSIQYSTIIGLLYGNVKIIGMYKKHYSTKGTIVTP